VSAGHDTIDRVDCTQRIIKIAEGEFPGSTVVFDDNAGSMIRFRIDDVFGHILSKAFPHYLASEIDDWTNEKLRAVIRSTCGFSN